MKKFFALISIAAALSACSKQEPAPAAPAATPPAAAAPAATAPAAAAPAATAPAASTTTAALPQDCQAYLDKVNACMSKQSGAAADAVKASMEQTKAAWASLSADQAQLGTACKAATDAFAAQAAAMKC